jgi:hypothetical protein
VFKYGIPAIAPFGARALGFSVRGKAIGTVRWSHLSNAVSSDLAFVKALLEDLHAMTPQRLRTTRPPQGHPSLFKRFKFKWHCCEMYGHWQTEACQWAVPVTNRISPASVREPV